ncbi:hypothetical protein [Kitasatospora sp. NPDC093558]|uniref:hypothetical protein n=1 Tax=Kitasatospora sp. NPDC093558 TaxID=3155201 RepID=UPI0034322665
MNLSFGQDIEQIAAVTLTVASAAASRLADRGFRDDRYDPAAALAAGAYTAQATSYLPLPDIFPEDNGAETDYRGLADRLERIADALDDLGTRSTEVRRIRDRHTAALHIRNAAIALRNALPVGDGAAE